MHELDAITEESLVAKGSRKWSSFPGSIGAFIAEMDFGVAPVVREALDEIDSRDLYGYAPTGMISDLQDATSTFYAERHGWRFAPNDVQPASDVLAAFLGVLDFLTPADTPIVLPTPAYMPFFDVAAVTGRRLIEVPMLRDIDGWSIDLDALDTALSPGAIMVLCNPHNPIGKVYTESELLALAEIVDRNGARVFSDEIHAPLVYSPAEHIPYASLNEVTAAHTATATAASKAFNIPGLKCAQLILSNDRDRRVWAKKGQFVSGAASNAGILATTAAYTRGAPWLAKITDYLQGNRDLLVRTLAEKLPRVHAGFIPPEGTYLAWLDLRGQKSHAATAAHTGIPSTGATGTRTAVPGLAEYFNSHAGVAVTDGRLCGEIGEGHIRFNFALPRPLLSQALERLANAV